MLEYTFNSWRNYVVSKVIGDQDVTLELAKLYYDTLNSPPDLVEFCSHHLNQCAMAWAVNCKSGIAGQLLGGASQSEVYAKANAITSVEAFKNAMPSKWVDLYLAALRLKTLIESDNQEQAAFVMYELGRASESLAYPENEEILEMAGNSKKWLQYTRNNNVYKRNQERSICKMILQDLAAQRWKLDVREEIHLKKMCQYIWDMAVEVPGMRDALPDKQDGLRNWLKPIAEIHAKYAVKPGRRPTKL